MPAGDDTQVDAALRMPAGCWRGYSLKGGLTLTRKPALSISKHQNFQDRRAAADAAKKQLLEKFKARPASDSPEMLAKQAERARIAAEREKRAAEREQARREKAERLQREEEARKAAAEEAANADRLAKEEADKARIEQVMQYEAERKAARDARYAARKARK